MEEENNSPQEKVKRDSIPLGDTEFNLSVKRWSGTEVFHMKDVKEFIKRLKEVFDYTFWAKFDYNNCLILEGEFKEEINKLVGDDLIENGRRKS
jgi:hypothetical protein